MQVDEIFCGEAAILIPQLEDGSVNAVITSPPYAEQRKNLYGGITEADYPDWFDNLMTLLRPKLADDGSVLVVIRSHVWEGQVSDYVMRTRLKVRDSGWIECEELIWYKPNSPPMGSIKRPRRAFEQILWFSKVKQPYVNLTAGGNQSERLGFEGGYSRFGVVYNGKEKVGKEKILLSGKSDGVTSGQSRRTDVFVAGVSENAKGIDHPAIYPISLCNALIETFSRPGDVILDPFVGSGSTALSAQSLGRKYIGFDISQDYVTLSKQRLTHQKPGEGLPRLFVADTPILCGEPD